MASLAVGQEEEEEEEELQIIVVGRGGLSSIRCGVGAVVPPQLRLMWLIVATAVVLKPLQLGSAGFFGMVAPTLLSPSPLPPFFVPLGDVFCDPAPVELHTCSSSVGAPLKRWLKGCNKPPSTSSSGDRGVPAANPEPHRHWLGWLWAWETLLQLLVGSVPSPGPHAEPVAVVSPNPFSSFCPFLAQTRAVP